MSKVRQLADHQSVARISAQNFRRIPSLPGALRREDGAFDQKIRDHPKAQRKPERQPDSMGNHAVRDAVAAIEARASVILPCRNYAGNRLNLVLPF
ncbi:hypothetical protein D3P04_14180 [Paracoccus onubensis]|uniref:Uncharacterized protein n=1 Tax=Paracoccus onubensis TaxID=1675788 RepID=A0A418ST67_9RHOB|nr:hypothetical protein D3P04_14180 [Paracoccus onubensis]